MQRQEALTRTYNGLANRITIPVTVTNDKGESKEFPALIDTGATHTCVSAELATELGLIAVGVTDTETAGGTNQVAIYVVDISMWDERVRFPKHKVFTANLTKQPEVEMLIGMDILLAGDFALTNQNGQTTMTFRIPSMTRIDFVPTANNHNRFAGEQARRQANRGKNKKKKKRRR